MLIQQMIQSSMAGMRIGERFGSFMARTNSLDAWIPFFLGIPAVAAAAAA